MLSYSKDGITVAAILDNRRVSKSGEFPVKIRVTYQRRRRYYPTGQKLCVQNWGNLAVSKSQVMIKTRQDIENSFVIVKKAVEALAYDSFFSFDALDARLSKGVDSSLCDAFRAKIELLRQEERIGTALYYENILRTIERFAGNNTPINRVSIDWVKRLEKFMRTNGNSATSIGMTMRGIRAILNEAKRAGVVKESQYPFGRGKYEIQAGEGRKMALTAEQIGMVARYDDGTDTTAKYRDYWLFMYLCNGINVADMIKLRYRDIKDDEICFIRQKTSRTTKTLKEVRAVMTEPMRQIIARRGNPPQPDGYIFPILTGEEDATKEKYKCKYFTRAINKRMALVAEALGIAHISTYTARHSFATVLKRSGVNIAYISESLGHSDLRTTENYLSSFEREEREKNADLLIKF